MAADALVGTVATVQALLAGEQQCHPRVLPVVRMAHCRRAEPSFYALGCPYPVAPTPVRDPASPRQRLASHARSLDGQPLPPTRSRGQPSAGMAADPPPVEMDCWHRPVWCFPKKGTLSTCCQTASYCWPSTLRLSSGPASCARRSLWRPARSAGIARTSCRSLQTRRSR